MLNKEVLVFRVKALDYPLLDLKGSCTICGQDQEEEPHRITLAMETFKDRTVGIYVNRSCNRCGYSWGENVPSEDKLAEMNKPLGVKGFGGGKDE